MIGLSSGHRWRGRRAELLGQSLVRTGEVVVHEVEAHGVRVVLDLLGKAVGEPIAGTISDIGAVPATTNLLVAVVKEDKSVVSSQNWKIDIDLPEVIKHLPTIEPSVGFAVPLRFEVDEPGTYQVGIGLDGAMLGGLPLAIALDQPLEDELRELL